MNLKESARRWVLDNLPYDKSDPDLSRYLGNQDAHGLLTIFHNWMSRLVRPVPRVVHRSRALLGNPIASARSGDLAVIVAHIEQGRDLGKYLSRAVGIAAKVPGKKLHRRRDLDLMLNDWGIHHLHISTQVEADGFVTRDGPLLFAAFRPDAAYLIDVMGHGDWVSDRLVQVLVDEWPDEGLVHEVKGGPGFKVTGLARPYTGEERLGLRRRGSMHCWRSAAACSWRQVE